MIAENRPLAFNYPSFNIWFLKVSKTIEPINGRAINPGAITFVIPLLQSCQFPAHRTTHQYLLRSLPILFQLKLAYVSAFLRPTACLAYLIILIRAYNFLRGSRIRRTILPGKLTASRCSRKFNLSPLLSKSPKKKITLHPPPLAPSNKEEKLR